MHKCIVCGKLHCEFIKGEFALLYLQHASKYLYKQLEEHVDIDKITSPLCKECIDEYIKYLDNVLPVIASEFALVRLQNSIVKQQRANKIIQGQQKAIGFGRKAGRKRSIDYDKVKEMRLAGHSYGEIAEVLKVSKTAVCKIIKMEPL